MWIGTSVFLFYYVSIELNHPNYILWAWLIYNGFLFSFTIDGKRGKFIIRLEDNTYRNIGINKGETYYKLGLLLYTVTGIICWYFFIPG